jgi:release factor glutamine methyltransferase
VKRPAVQSAAARHTPAGTAAGEGPAVAITVASWIAQHRALPRLECELLLCHRLGIGRAAVIAYPERELPRAVVAALDADAARLVAGEPFAYVTGEREFFGLTLAVTPDVLIPRPETETLVALALERLAPGRRVLDLGTGSGAIAIALASRLDLDAIAVDASPAALGIARRNALTHRVRVRFLQSDWFEKVRGRFDLIVANPPYVADGDPHLPALRFEPRDALTAGPLGLDALHSIVDAAGGFLRPGGWLLLEHGYNQGAAVARRLIDTGFDSVETVRDLGGRDRVTLGRWEGPA